MLYKNEKCVGRRFDSIDCKQKKTESTPTPNDGKTTGSSNWPD